ncbi:MAG: hypothetical protein ISS69_11030 [Phycisphaerae bacterium]|nr:hypothetical protein [Planctomycetota bacterium]MBL7220638.1 hypothetical protein [Phycisphaerae bacterium]
MKKIGLLPWIIAAIALASLGCTSRTFSTTSRTAIEQLLLTRAVDVAMVKFDMPELANKKVFIDFTNLKCYDAEYVKVAVRSRIAQIGSRLADSADDADLTVEVASGALALEYKTGVIGMPALPVPNSPAPLPAMPFYRSTEQTAIVKLLIFVHDSGKFVASHMYYAKADRDESFILQWRATQQDDVRTGWEQAELKPKSK